MGRRSRSISGHTRATMIGFYLLGLATIVMGLGGYMITVLSGHLVITYGSGTYTTLTNITDLYLGTTGYVENFTINNYNLPYTLIVGNGSTTHNMTVVYNQAFETITITETTLTDITYIKVHGAEEDYGDYISGYYVGGDIEINITDSKGDNYYIDADLDNGTGLYEFDEIRIYKNNVLVKKYYSYDTSYGLVFYFDNRTLYVDDMRESGEVYYSYELDIQYPISITINVHEISPVKITYQRNYYKYYLDDSLVLSDQNLLPIKYIYDDLYINNNIVLENYTITSIQSSEPITLTVYYKSGTFDLGFIPGIIVVSAGIFILIRAITLIAGVRL